MQPIKKYTLTALCALSVALTAQAQKNTPQQTAEDYINHYQFDQAEELINKDIKIQIEVDNTCHTT